jgi:hypothetical protein
MGSWSLHLLSGWFTFIRIHVEIFSIVWKTTRKPCYWQQNIKLCTRLMANVLFIFKCTNFTTETSSRIHVRLLYTRGKLLDSNYEWDQPFFFTVVYITTRNQLHTLGIRVASCGWGTANNKFIIIRKEIKFMSVCRYQTTAQNHFIRLANKSLENVAKFKYLGPMITNANCIHE